VLGFQIVKVVLQPVRLILVRVSGFAGRIELLGQPLLFTLETLVC
jgi:hypothetical protein